MLALYASLVSDWLDMKVKGRMEGRAGWTFYARCVVIYELGY